MGENHAVVALRGSGELVLLDKNATEVARAKAPSLASALSVVGSDVLVVGEGSDEIWRFSATLSGTPALERRAVHRVPGALSIKAIEATKLNRVVVADSVTGEVFAVDTTGNQPVAKKRKTIARCHDPIGLLEVADTLLINCASDHEVRLVGNDGNVRAIKHDGPIWAMAASIVGGNLVIALAGIEDRPLDRSDQGSFGYIDSFLFVYRASPTTANAERIAMLNVGEHGVITPKWLELSTANGAAMIETAGYGSSKRLALTWPGEDFSKPPTIKPTPFLPGTVARAHVANSPVYANAIFDGVTTNDGKRIAIGPDDSRTTESKVGELLFFTELMAPWSTSTARKSKFTCEACHLDGYVDGRVHFTGRDDVSATSRPLRGLFNNSPHFSRALDESSTEMVNNEFRVANKLNGRSSWFELKAADFPWLKRGGLAAPEVMSPVYLRRSLMVFLRDFTHQPNPAVRGRKAFNKLEAQGAEVFRDRCEECHRAQLNASNEKTRINFGEWPAHIFSDRAGIVWGRMGYEKTGVLPYVHERGARPPTLRRLYRKWPYFTNGSAKTLVDVIAGARHSIAGDGFSHVATKDGKAFSTNEKTALLAFLELL